MLRQGRSSEPAEATRHTRRWMRSCRAERKMGQELGKHEGSKADLETQLINHLEDFYQELDSRDHQTILSMIEGVVDFIQKRNLENERRKA